MSNDKYQKPKSGYDLSERTSVFAEKILDLCKQIPKNEINKPLIHQLVKSSTSIGANYMEADCAESRKDFIHKSNKFRKPGIVFQHQ